MRVTGGELGGRRFEVPRTGVRPTQDRVREALFSSLAARIPGCRFLDLFAGSGSVGLEAWSRGAARVVWVERDPRVCRVLQENVVRLCGPEGGERGRVVLSDALRFLTGRGPPEVFDVVFADPPYDREGTRGWAGRMFEPLANGGWLEAGGRFVLEQAEGELAPSAAGWSLQWERRYGGTQMRMFRRG